MVFEVWDKFDNQICQVSFCRWAVSECLHFISTDISCCETSRATCLQITGADGGAREVVSGDTQSGLSNDRKIPNLDTNNNVSSAFYFKQWKLETFFVFPPWQINTLKCQFYRVTQKLDLCLTIKSCVTLSIKNSWPRENVWDCNQELHPQ